MFSTEEQNQITTNEVNKTDVCARNHSLPAVTWLWKSTGTMKCKEDETGTNNTTVIRFVSSPKTVTEHVKLEVLKCFEQIAKHHLMTESVKLQ